MLKGRDRGNAPLEGWLRGADRGGETMSETIIVKPSVAKRFEEFLRQGRVLFFNAPCGFGKTVVADALLSGRASSV